MMPKKNETRILVVDDEPDVLELIERIRERVSEQCAVDLELEIGIW